MNPLYPDVAKRAGMRCEYCRAPERVFNFPFEVEHIQPRSIGGNDASDNLALACDACNLHKGAATSGWDEATAQLTSFFHPRQEQWNDHFWFDSELAEVHGTTSVGRVTVIRLKMNSQSQVRARQDWIKLRLYP